VAPLLALLEIRNVFSEAACVRRLELLRVLDPLTSGRFHLTSRHIRVGKRRSGREMRIVDPWTVIGQAHVISTEEAQWIVNHRIDPRTLNERHQTILYYWIVYNMHTAELKLEA